MASPIVFHSTDSGAPAGPSGTLGTLLATLDGCLICRMVFTSTDLAGTTSIVDNTNKARSQSTATNAGTWLPFQTATPGAATDACFIGLSAKFDRVKLSLSTPGTSVVDFVVEYWNSGAWVAVSGLSDGTSGLTASGTITWTIPSDWVTKALNSVTCYWIRLRYTSYSVMPIAQYCTVTGWTQAYGPTSNETAYQQGGGNLVFYDINDNGPGAGTTKEARVQGYETMSAIATGTGAFPTTAASFIRKSSLGTTGSPDGTARAYVIIADDRTAIVFISTGDTAGKYSPFYIGDTFSLVPNDNYRSAVFANGAENTATPTNSLIYMLTLGTTKTGSYLDRAYHGVGAAAVIGMHTDSIKWAGGVGTVPFPNGADGGLWLAPINIHEASSTIRGRLRGLLCVCHATANFTDGDTFSGAGAYAGRTFLIVKTVDAGSGGTTGFIAIETSNTWETD